MMCKYCSLKCIASDCDCICHNKKEEEKLVWEYQDCEFGKKKRECCQECIANKEPICCECREMEEKNER